MAVPTLDNKSDINQLIVNEGPSSSRKKRIGFALVVVILAAAGTGMYLYNTAARAQPSASYEFGSVTRGDLNSVIDTTGTVDAINTVEVGAEISGQIEAIKVDYNDSVKKGDMLALLDPRQQQANVTEAKAKVAAARAGSAQAKALLLRATQNEQRVKSMALKGLNAQKEVEIATADAAVAKATLNAAKANAVLSKATFDSAVDTFSKTEIKSPIDGMVLSRLVEVGQSVNAGMTTPVLFTLAEDLRIMQLSSQVDEADIGSVKPGQTATFTVDAYSGKQFLSKVVSVRNVATVESNVVSYEVLLTVDNSKLLLKPGMTATVEITTESKENVLLVPNKALRFTPPKDASSAKRRGPPQSPLLGGAKKSGSENKHQQVNQSVNPLQANEGRLWIMKNGRPVPIVVTKEATDGTNTAIRSVDISEGMQFILALDDAGI